MASNLTFSFPLFVVLIEILLDGVQFSQSLFAKSNEQRAKSLRVLRTKTKQQQTRIGTPPPPRIDESRSQCEIKRPCDGESGSFTHIMSQLFKVQGISTDPAALNEAHSERMVCVRKANTTALSRFEKSIYDRAVKEAISSRCGQGPCGEVILRAQTARH